MIFHVITINWHPCFEEVTLLWCLEFTYCLKQQTRWKCTWNRTFLACLLSVVLLSWKGQFKY